MPTSSQHTIARPPGPPSERESAEIAATLSALSAPSRVAILFVLREGEIGVNDLAARVGLSQPATSQQLRVLRQLGWVAAERRGRSVTYSLHDPHVAELLDAVRDHADHNRTATSRVAS